MKNHRLSVAGALGALVFAGSAFAEFRGFVAFVRNLDGKTVVDVFAGVGNSSDRLLNCYNRSISTSATAGFVQQSGAATHAWRPAPASNGRGSSVDSFMTIGVEGGAPYAGDFRPSGTTSADGAFVNWSASPAAAVPPNAGWYASPPTLPDNVAEDLSLVPGIRHDLSGAGGVSHGIWCAHLVVSNADPSFTIGFGGQASIKDGLSNSLSQGSSSGTISITPDLDGDGVPDPVDACPNESGPVDCNGCPLNACGSCGTALDTDGDGSPDCVDADDDNDGYDDGADAFPLDAAEWQDTDGDGQGDNSDGDDDGDGVLDAVDNCPRNPNALQEDLDSDGSGDACDADDDGDGASDTVDNCPSVANPAQSDLDGDGAGDACDSDDDNDGIGDDADNCDAIANPSQADCDSDGIGDACELAAGEADLNQNGRPDGCDIAWVPSGNAAGAVRWDAASGIGAGGQWYLLSTERVDLATAKVRAAELGGRLASITSQAEWEFLRAMLAAVPNQSYWVGLERPCWCCGWVYASGESYGRWSAPWNFQDCNTAVAVSYAGNWRTSAPAELRRYLIEFDFADLDHDGVLDAHDGQMAVDCNQDGQRDSQQIAITPSLDCDSSATLDSCDTARVPYYADQYVQLPGAGETVVLNLPVNAGTSSSVRVRVDAVGDYGEPYKGEWVDVDIEGLALMRLQDAQCSWAGAERTFARVVAEPVLADGVIRVTFTVGEGVDPQTCGSHSARVQAWYSLPTTTPDLNENGRPDACDPGWTPDFSQLPGIVQRSPGHWYWVSNEVRNYPDAVVRARSLGGRLVTITSEPEFEFIRNELGVSPRESFWMAMSRACGVSDLADYAWTTGERVSFLPNWVHDVYSTSDPCYYTSALLVPGRGFHVAHPWWGSRYIIEFDLRDCNSNGQLDLFELQDQSLDCDVDGALDSCGGMTGSDCDANLIPDRCEIRNGAPDRDGNGRPDSCDFAWVPSGAAAGATRWDRSTGDRHWYKLVTDAVWYEEAAEIARRMGGHLLTITSQDEASFIEGMLRNTPGEYWIGMDRPLAASAVSDFVWRTGEPRSYEPYWYYSNPEHDAVALSTSEGWRSAPRVSESRYFIVEFDFRDADGDGLFDWQELIDPSLDCDRDGMLDAVQVAAGLDDCNANGTPDRCDVAAGAPDWNQNGRPDSCDADWTPASDYPGARQMVRNGIGGKWYLLSPEATGYEVAKQRAAAMGGRLATLANPGEFGFVRNEVVAPTGTVFWVGMERQPSQCDTASFRWITGEPIRQALNWVGNGCWGFDAAIINSSGDFESRPRWEARRYLVEFDLADCNANGQRDWQEMLDVTLDSDNDGLLDSCELAAGYDDCNGNGVADAIDIVSGLPDVNSNGRPDSCDSSWTPGGATAGAVRWQYGAGSSGGGAGHWFLASTDRMDYYTAKDYARSLGGRLAAITSQAEWDFVRSTIAGNPDRTYWIGVERPCWCCGWQAISGESFGQWGPPWSLNDCNLAASVSYSSSWRSSNPFEQRHFLVEFDFDDVDGDGVLDAGQASQLVDCNQNGLRDPVEVALYPSLDCNENGRPDSCDTARAPFYAEVYANLPSAGEELLVPLTVNPGTSSPVRVRVDAVSDLGEPVKGEWLDVDLEGLGTFRLQGSQCGWVGGERTFPMNVALPALADGKFTVRVTVGPGVDIAACGENRVRVQAWYSLPTLVDDLNQNGRPDSCEIGSEPPSSLRGVVERVPGQWYWLSDDARTYDGALARARELGGHLVTITSQAEWEFVRTRVGLSWGPLAWVGFERTCESNGLDGYAWTTGEARAFELPWIHTYTDCNWRWALMRTDGLHTGYAWWCCHHYIVEFDYRDCDGNGRLDMFDPASSGPDCDGDGVFDGCQLSVETDCDGDGVLDACQIASGAGDSDGDGVLDACETVFGDLNGDGIVDGFDLTVLLASWGATGDNPADLNDDGIVNGADLGIVLVFWGSTGP